MLDLSARLWSGLIYHLRNASAGIQESGAFIVGSIVAGERRGMDFIPYEMLERGALNEDFVQLSSEAFSKLWAMCDNRGVEIVGDIHSHRFGVQQSRSDRTNPMLALPGHVAIIVPEFAQRQVALEDVGVYVYQGAHRWVSHYGADVHQVLRLEANQ
jgi:hypothetical protein